MSVEHNFYQLMGIDWFSDIEIVKKKYKELAKKYHPDTQPRDKNVEEYFKILTQGYHLLSNQDNKLIYDQQLKAFYQKNEHKEYSKTLDLKEKIKRNEERKKQKIINNYLKEDETLSFKYRLLGSVLLYAWGVLIVYNNWFINYLSYNIIIAFIGFLIYGTGCYLISNNLFKKEQFNAVMNLNEIPQSFKAVQTFLKLFILSPIVFLVIVYTSSTIQLKYFYDFAPIKEVNADQNEVVYIYKVDENEMMRKIEADPFKNYNNKKKLRVKYSKINPLISELVFINEL